MTGPLFIFLVVTGGSLICAALFVAGWRATASVLWAFTIVLVSLPFESFVTHSHWDKIGWIPFYSWPVRPLDVLENIVLYMPLGYLAVDRSTRTRATESFATKARKHGKRLLYGRLGAVAFVLSLSMEVIQDFSHSRFPSATDLVCNVAGALLGATLANRH